MDLIFKANCGKMCVALELDSGEISYLQNYMSSPTQDVFPANVCRARASLSKEVDKMLQFIFLENDH